MLKWFFGFLFPLLCAVSGLQAQVHRAHTRAEQAGELLIKGGWQQSAFMQSDYSSSFKPGWHAGVGLKMPIGGPMWFQPEILYSKRSATLTYDAAGSTAAYTATHAFSHITYPLLFAYRGSDIIEVHFGPQFAVMLSNDLRSDSPQAVRLSPADFNKWEFGIAGGLELNVSPLALGARYVYSLRELAMTEYAREQLGGARLHGLQLYGAVVF